MSKQQYGVKVLPMDAQANSTYQIQEVLGKGHTGTIYKAQDVINKRTVAIKLMHLQLLDDVQNIQRFQNEARAISAIIHANVVSAFDCGINESGQPYMVLSFIEGPKLSELLQASNGLEWRRVLNIMLQACEAMEAAHKSGILHRNLKPAKVMVTKFMDQSDFVKIIGFGLAERMPVQSTSKLEATQPSDIIGTPLYMSPEQFLGERVDERSDVYSLGCVMYECLTGQAPFSAEHTLELMHKHLHTQAKKFAEIRPDLEIPARVESACFRALEKEANKRFQSMHEFKDSLLRCSKGSNGLFSATFANILSHLKRNSK